MTQNSTPFDLLEQTKKENYLVILTQVITPVFILLSLFGNVTLIIATKKFGKIWKQPINILILNNSICNLAIAAIFFPLYVATLSTDDEAWLQGIRGRTFCYVSLFLHYWIPTVLHLSLILVVGSQLRIILRTLKQRKMKKKTAKRIMGYAWIVAFLLCIGVILTHEGDAHCIHGWIEWHSTEENFKGTVFLTTLIVAVFILPKCLITLFYLALAFKLRRRETKAIWKPSYSILYARRIEQKRTTVKKMLYILFLFLITWTPAHAQQILLLLDISAIKDEQQQKSLAIVIVTYVVNFIVFAHAWLSPLMVALSFSKYRVYYRDLWKQKTTKRGHVQPEASSSAYNRKLSNISEL